MMINTILTVTLALQGQLSIEPQDYLTANMAQIRAEVSFTVKCGTAKPSALKYARIWADEDLSINEFVDRRVLGTWASDGHNEKYHCYPEDREKVKKDIAEALKSSDLVSIRGENVYLFNQKAYAWIDVFTGVVTVNKLSLKDNRFDVFGPYFRWAGEDLQAVLKKYDSRKVTSTNTRGHFYVVEIYKTKVDQGWGLFEIHYDPSVGYLPRYCKIVGYSDDLRPMTVMETFVVSTLHTKSGGFLPEKWYMLKYEAKFDKAFIEPCSSIEANITSDVNVRAYDTNKFNDLSGQITINFPSFVVGFSTNGGYVKLPVGFPKDACTLDDLLSTAGSKLYTKPVIKPIHLDRVDDYVPAKTRIGEKLIIFVPFALGLFYFAMRKWYKGKMICFFLSFFILSGCSESKKELNDVPNTGFRSEAKLIASFKNATFVINPSVINPSVSSPLDLQLILSNKGQLPVKVLSVKGDCSCRYVEQKSLPSVLQSGESIELAVRTTPKLQQEVQHFSFAIATDTGTMVAPVNFLAVPSYQFEPDGLNVKYNEKKKVTFNVKVIGASFSNGFERELTLIPPKGIRINLLASSDLPEDTLNKERIVYRHQWDYELHFLGSEVGTFKENLDLISRSGEKILPFPIVWKRIEFLSTVPEKVIISEQPVRVFLNCPDDSIELDQILDVPLGIKAVITSPRELIISIKDNATDIIDSYVKVSTTATEEKPLMIRVIRYNPASYRGVMK